MFVACSHYAYKTYPRPVSVRGLLNQKPTSSEQTATEFSRYAHASIIRQIGHSDMMNVIAIYKREQQSLPTFFFLYLFVTKTSHQHASPYSWPQNLVHFDLVDANQDG